MGLPRPPCGLGRPRPSAAQGCLDLLDELQTRVKPRYHVFGHIHEGYGVTTNGLTAFLNAAVCTQRYKVSLKALKVMKEGYRVLATTLFLPVSACLLMKFTTDHSKNSNKRL